MQQQQIVHNTHLSTMKQTTVMDNDSPHRTRVYYKKYLNEVNQALQALITAGRLKRMELMSINNRALFNRGKVQRCEWMTKRHSEAHENFLPDIKHLNLDNRSPQRKSASTYKRYNTQTNHPSQQSLVDMLIEQQINRIKKQNMLESGRRQEDIVYESCKNIQQKLISKLEKRSKQRLSILPIDVQSSHYRYVTLRKQHRRSATQSSYSHQLESIQKKRMAMVKMRESERKYFLRKIKICNRKK